jgi:DNA polymerase V
MIALVDCVSFYANVERQFHASLQNRPVVVLSLNDGNIISLSADYVEYTTPQPYPL